VFYFNLILGFALYIILFFAAPFISFFFKEPILINVTRVLGLVLIINAISIVQRTILIKAIDFKTQTKISLISSIISGIIGVFMAFLKFGIWSLVCQQILKQTLNTLFLWVFNRWRPAKEFSIQSFKELFGFGWKLLVSGLIDTIYRNIYYIIIGKFYTASQLGQYTRAEQFNNMFSSNLTSVVQRVSYPILSTIQDETDRLRLAYRRIVKTTMLITFAFMLGLAAVAKPLIILLIGIKWLPAVSFLQIICFAGMLYPLHAINLNILQVKGRSDLFLKLEIIKKIIAIIPIIIGIYYGIAFMLVGSVIISLISFLLNSFYSSNLIGYSTWLQIKDIFPAFFVSICVSGVMWSLTFLNLPVSITIIIQFLIGILMAIVIYETIKLPEYKEIKEMAIKTYKKNI
jgi:O-antigen/teichoic acid export membrane protein